MLVLPAAEEQEHDREGAQHPDRPQAGKGRAPAVCADQAGGQQRRDRRAEGRAAEHHCQGQSPTLVEPAGDRARPDVGLRQHHAHCHQAPQQHPVGQSAGGAGQQGDAPGVQHHARQRHPARAEPVGQHADSEIEQHAQAVADRQADHHLRPRPAELLFQRGDEGPDGIGLDRHRRVADRRRDRHDPVSPPFRFRQIRRVLHHASLPIRTLNETAAPFARDRRFGMRDETGDQSPKRYFTRMP